MRDGDGGESPERAGQEEGRVPGREGRFGTTQALYFYGVARARAWRGGSAEREEVQRIRYRDLEALVRPVPFRLPPVDEAHVLIHQRAVEGAMRRGTVLPAPYGVVFRGRRPLIRMLEDQYLVLDEGLAFLEGHWELRLHVALASGVERHVELNDLAMQLYSELRQHARAAVPFAQQGRRLLSVAFLVDRTSWVEFVERADDLGDAHPELTIDITGPWPAYDFVRVVQ